MSTSHRAQTLITRFWVTCSRRITRGVLSGEFFGMPKSVLVAAAEDSWSQTIVPRLIAAGADLDRVFRVEITADAVHSELIRPRDLANHRQHHNHDHRNHHRSGGQVGQWRLCRPPPPTQRTRSRVRKVAHEVDAVADLGPTDQPTRSEARLPQGR
jgi:hypothetical protein